MTTKARNGLTAEDLRAVLSYSPDTGIFVWISGVRNGQVAGNVDNLGYRRICVFGRFYKAHRLAWFYVNGKWPIEIDHVNGVRDDNRLVNLRAANRSINVQNVGPRRNNTSGFTGVSFYRRTGRWRAQIKNAGRTVHLGDFDQPEAAHDAYMEAKKRLHPSFARRSEHQPKRSV